VIKKISKRNHGAGFTLVEMLVVLVIIAILAGLISAVAYRGIARAKVARIGVDISQLSQALNNYKTQFGEYPPDFSDTSANGQAIILRHIAKAFPRFTSTWYGAASHPLDWPNLRQEILINSSNLIDLNNMTPATALAFWLGGMPDAQGKPCGFSKNPADPFESPVTTPSRTGPLFEFDPGRLTMTSGTVADNGKYFAPGIIVGNGQPYIYLRAEIGQPDQKREYYSYDGTKTPPTYTFKLGGTSGAKPYWDQRNQGWVNPDSFQILCCGLDGKFGKENVYPTGLVAGAGVPDGTSGGLPDLTADVMGTASTGFPAGNFDHIDDQTNFTKGTIGDDLP
jgi:prepilin-type N-terminal cleavage/methylation domain-containing protein